MGSLEFNKIAAGLLVALLLAVGVGKLGDVLYGPDLPARVATGGHGADAAAAAGDGALPDDAAATTVAAADPAAVDAVDVFALIAGASVEDGESVARKCRSCHTFEEGGANRVGPNLWDMVDRDIASVEGFSYSDAMEAQEGVWTYDRLWSYLMDPRADVPGTRMGFRGVGDEEDLAALIAWLRVLSDDPAPIGETP